MNDMEQTLKAINNLPPQICSFTHALNLFLDPNMDFAMGPMATMVPLAHILVALKYPGTKVVIQEANRPEKVEEVIQQIKNLLANELNLVKLEIGDGWIRNLQDIDANQPPPPRIEIKDDGTVSAEYNFNKRKDHA